MFVLEILASGDVVAPARDFLEFTRVELHAIVVWHFAVIDDSHGGLDWHVERRQLRLVASARVRERLATDVSNEPTESILERGRQGTESRVPFADEEVELFVLSLARQGSAQ